MYESSKSIADHFLPLNVQVLAKNFLRKSCSISAKLTQIYFKKHQFCSDNICMSHQSQLHVFFCLLMYKSWRKICEGKVVPLVQN